MKILVTAGPTREPIDPARFISNRSSGKMGYAIARSAIERRHEVVLISGPVGIEPPAGAILARVNTARDMLNAVKERVSWCDALVMAAAVADWRPKNPSAQKLKKTEAPPVIELEPTDDILESVRGMKGKRVFVGFAAETRNLVEEAGRKLRAKSLDMIVANDISRSDSGFEVETNKVTLISSDGKIEELPLMSKSAVAGRIIEWLERRAAE